MHTKSKMTDIIHRDPPHIVTSVLVVQAYSVIINVTPKVIRDDITVRIPLIIVVYTSI